MKKNHKNLRSSASQKGFTPLKKSGGEIKLFRMPFQWNLFRKSSSLTGFTLLEVMVAMVILTVGLLGMASLTASIIRTNSFSDDFTTATALAQDQLEAIANAPWIATTPTFVAGNILFDSNTANNDSVNLTSMDVTPVNLTDNQVAGVNQCGTTDCTTTACTTVSGHCKFTRTWNIWDRTDLIAAPNTTRKDIAVIVSWTSSNLLTRSITMTTIKTQTQ